jgi:hypothetical protein
MRCVKGKTDRKRVPDEAFALCASMCALDLAILATGINDEDVDEQGAKWNRTKGNVLAVLWRSIRAKPFQPGRPRALNRGRISPLPFSRGKS